jgi:uncharacterized protein (TIGR00369 family)
MSTTLENDDPKPEYRNCFMCGQGNPRGLQLKLKDVEGKAEAAFFADRSLEGYDGIIHGGITSALLDEVMVWSAFYTTGHHAVTSELSVRFLKPVRVGQTYRVLGGVKEIRRRIVLAEASLTDEAGVVAARGEGRLFMVKGE